MKVDLENVVGLPANRFPLSDTELPDLRGEGEIRRYVGIDSTA